MSDPGHAYTAMNRYHNSAQKAAIAAHCCTHVAELSTYVWITILTQAAP